MTRSQLKSIIKNLLREEASSTTTPNVDVNQPVDQSTQPTEVNPKIQALNKKKESDLLLKQKLEASMVPKQKKIDQLTKDLIPIKKKVSEVSADIEKVNQELDRETIDEGSYIKGFVNEIRGEVLARMKVRRVGMQQALIKLEKMMKEDGYDVD
jgi:septal ring factor EnvC (AmiA/AmiB activator)